MGLFLQISGAVFWALIIGGISYAAVRAAEDKKTEDQDNLIRRKYQR